MPKPQRTTLLVSAVLGLMAQAAPARADLAAPPRERPAQERSLTAPGRSAEREARYAGLSLADAIRRALVDNDLDFALTTLGALGASTGDPSAQTYYNALRAFGAGEFETAATAMAGADRQDLLGAALLAWAEVGRGRGEEGVKVWDAYGASRSPAFHATYRGLLAEAVGKPEEAITFYRRAEIQGELLFARDITRRYALLLARRGEARRAQEAFDTVFGPPEGLNPRDAAFRQSLRGRPGSAAPVRVSEALSSLMANFAAGSIVAREMRDRTESGGSARGPAPDAESLFVNDALTLRSALLVDPSNVEARLKLSEVLVDAEEEEAAGDVLEPALNSPFVDQIRVELAGVRADAWRPSDGIAVMDATPADKRDLDWWLTRSVVHATQARWTEALAAARRGRELAASRGETAIMRADLTLANALRNSGDMAGAMRTAQGVLNAAAKGGLISGYAGLFLSRFDATRSDGLAAARLALESPGVSDDFKAGFAGALVERPETRDEGVRILRDLLAEAPRSPTRLNNLGYTLVDHRIDVREGFQLLQRAFEAKPRSPAIADSFGWAHYQLGQFEEARRLIELAVSLSADAPDAEIHDNLGDVYWRLGRQDDARAQWRRSLDIGNRLESHDALRRKIDEGLTEPAPKAEEVPLTVAPGSV